MQMKKIMKEMEGKQEERKNQPRIKGYKKKNPK